MRLYREKPTVPAFSSPSLNMKKYEERENSMTTENTVLKCEEREREREIQKRSMRLKC